MRTPPPAILGTKQAMKILRKLISQIIELVGHHSEGNAAAKTGSISNVRALSGYVRTRDGEMLVFAILANDFVIPSATVTWIADLAVEHLANFTRR